MKQERQLSQTDATLQVIGNDVIGWTVCIRFPISCGCNYVVIAYHL